MKKLSLRLFKKLQLSCRQKDEELVLLKSLVEKREDFQLLSRLNSENKDLRSQVNKLRIKELSLKKVIGEFKQKGFLKRIEG